MNETLILASASPRRRELLARFGLPMQVIPSLWQEPKLDHLPPEQQVLFLARGKAEEVASRCQGLIIAADTLVAIEGATLGKPRDKEEAAAMLRRLSGKEHQVYTALVLYSSLQDRRLEGVECTQVRFKQLTEEELQRYLLSGESMDKAGAYAVQGLASVFIERIEGCYHNVVGLPLHLLNQLLGSFGYHLV